MGSEGDYVFIVYGELSLDVKCTYFYNPSPINETPIKSKKSDRIAFHKLCMTV